MAKEDQYMWQVGTVCVRVSKRIIPNLCIMGKEPPVSTPPKFQQGGSKSVLPLETSNIGEIRMKISLTHILKIKLYKGL